MSVTNEVVISFQAANSIYSELEISIAHVDPVSHPSYDYLGHLLIGSPVNLNVNQGSLNTAPLAINSLAPPRDVPVTRQWTGMPDGGVHREGHL